MQNSINLLQKIDQHIARASSTAHYRLLRSKLDSAGEAIKKLNNDKMRESLTKAMAALDSKIERGENDLRGRIKVKRMINYRSKRGGR